MTLNKRAIKVIKPLAHLSCWVPLIYLFCGVLTKSLGADPQEAILHLLGYWSLIFLLMGLAITPFRRWFGLPQLIQFRRMLGLYAAFFALLHIMAFTAFYLDFNLSELINEVVERPYISLGMIAFTLMLPLVATSNRISQRKLARRWRKLHQLVYIIAILAVIHFIWQTKSDLNEPLIYALILVILLSARIYWAVKKPAKS